MIMIYDYNVYDLCLYRLWLWVGGEEQEINLIRIVFFMLQTWVTLGCPKQWWLCPEYR